VAGEVTPNGPIEIRGSDFEPNDHVRLELRKEGVEPIELGRVPVEADGSFSITLHVPESVEPGIYELAADGKESASTEVTVLKAAEGETGASPETAGEREVSSDAPAGETISLAIATALIALVGAGLIWLSRTRPRTGKTEGQ